MGITTGIDWCDSTINPLMGCNGCELWNPKAGVERCYAGRESRRRAGNKGWPARFDEPEFFPGRIEQAIKWPDLTGKERPDKPWLSGYPRLIFLDDLSDTFTEGKDPVSWLFPLVFKMEEAPHVWMFLTKRPRRMADFFRRVGRVPRNFWLGTTVTGLETVGRAHELLRIGEISPHALFWLSLEPLMGPVAFNTEVLSSIYLPNLYCFHCDEGCEEADCTCTEPKVGWVVVGGESGPAARPMHPDWARGVRDACQAARVRCFFKQWGEWAPESHFRPLLHDFKTEYVAAGKPPASGRIEEMLRVGRDRAGRMLDGREWVEMPRISPSPQPSPSGGGRQESFLLGEGV